ncbi:hypothetical protein DUNSADRAFT_15892 [Dunaliella salina]|uniref:Encoded protein n=1 Tax=Dunaliella salina TaxID=3046 RepID=A0ABQ7G4M9_DUNSA|nr:hypothetical protein DUNSADRAFT_15892 [Dunaliella salina]|eukprot:KAF5829565.1 hypothetical protein DUNSADRAFT_15892 [Dunaliella salina]
MFTCSAHVIPICLHSDLHVLESNIASSPSMTLSLNMPIPFLSGSSTVETGFSLLNRRNKRPPLQNN